MVSFIVLKQCNCFHTRQKESWDVELCGMHGVCTPHLLSHDDFIRLVIFEGQWIDALRPLKLDLGDRREEFASGFLGAWFSHGTAFNSTPRLGPKELRTSDIIWPSQISVTWVTWITWVNWVTRGISNGSVFHLYSVEHRNYFSNVACLVTSPRAVKISSSKVSSSRQASPFLEWPTTSEHSESHKRCTVNIMT